MTSFISTQEVTDCEEEEEEEEEAVDGLRDGVPVEWRCDDDAQDGFF